jgi:hypothetical protein
MIVFTHHPKLNQVLITSLFAASWHLTVAISTFIDAYNYAKRLKTLNGLTSYEYISKSHSKEPYRFLLNPTHQMPGLNILNP